MDLALLATLKDKLATATNFAEVMVYFFDHFGEDPDFMGQGESGRVPFLETVLAEVGKQLYKDSGRTTLAIDFRLVRLPEQQFVHGAVTLGGKPANVIYFEDVHIGLMTVIWSLKPPETKYVRFSGRQMPRNLTPSVN
jgi:hypothetical protein